ncbi:MAG: MFS transporter [Gammaproteobacteria bacterium]
MSGGATASKFAPRYRLPAVIEALLGNPLATPAPAAVRSGEDYYQIALPIRSKTALVGVLHLGIDARFVARQIEAISFDIVIVLVVALLVAFELLLLIATSSFSAPLQQFDALLQRLSQGDFSLVLTARARDRLGRMGHALNALVERINESYQELLRLKTRAPLSGRTDAPAAALDADRYAGALFATRGHPKSYRSSSLVPVRTATFLFVFAEELARPFFPVYVRELAAPISALSQEFLVGLSIAIFMLVMALVMPVVGFWSNRIGHRNLFLLGALLSTIGLGATGFALGYWDLLLWRALSALGYTLTFTACQGYVLDNTSANNRTQGVATFAGGIVAADICGPAIGGILAERIGYSATFAVGAALAIGAALLVLQFIPHYIPHRHHTSVANPPARRAAHFRELLANPRFLALMLFAAVPAKLLLTGFLFFLTPMLLTQLGSSQSEIGRIAMCYGVASIVFMPLFARLTDRWNAPGLMVGVGCMIAGAGMIPVLFTPTPATVLTAVIGLGAGQALSISSQVTLLTHICKNPIATYGAAPIMGVYRFIERLGSAAGPFVAVAFANAFGYSGAALALGIVGVVGATLFSAAFLILGLAPEDDDEAIAVTVN